MNSDDFGHNWGDSAIIFPRHEWKLLANHPTSYQNSLFTRSHISFYFWHDITGANTYINWWKLSSIYRCAIVVYGWSVDCAIVQTHSVTSFWLTGILIGTFLSYSRALSRHCQVDYHSIIIEWDSQHIHGLACKNCFPPHPSYTWLLYISTRLMIAYNRG